MDATIIYPHQLFSPNLHPAMAPERVVYIVEEPLLLTHNPIHRAKLVLHRLSLQNYQTVLTELGYTVHYIEIQKYTTTQSVFARLASDGVTTLHVCDTTDTYLEQAMVKACALHGFARTWYESPLFLLPRAEAVDRFQKSKRFMATFYKKMRQDTGLLMDDGEPVGGQWSFDADNRQKLPKGMTLPKDITPYPTSPAYEAAVAWSKTLAVECYGEPTWYLPITHEGAVEFLEEFLAVRLGDFGPYEDAIDTTHTRLYHSLLSPLMNIGLITPKQVVDRAVAYANKHHTPIASLEGFVRQIIGWREFIRASYESDGSMMRNKNFFGHESKLTNHWWQGDTGIVPLDAAISRALTYGYTHHIERLMVAGNLMLLSGLHPHEAYRWFMGMYIDAYDWVMVPNVYGMSQFADGGSFATKPYISGASYIKKMSNYPKGDWEATWTGLYWHFIAKNRMVFEKNYRLAMMPRLLDKMSPASKATHQKEAEVFISNTTL